MAGPASLSRGTGCSAILPWFTEGMLRACVYVRLTLSLLAQLGSPNITEANQQLGHKLGPFY